MCSISTENLPPADFLVTMQCLNVLQWGRFVSVFIAILCFKKTEKYDPEPCATLSNTFTHIRKSVQSESIQVCFIYVSN